MITAELLDRLVEATNEAKVTVRECHEARRDLKLAMKEADERIGKVRAEVVAAVEQLAVEKTKEAFERVDYEATGKGLKDALDKWLTLLADAQEVLEALNARSKVGASL